MKTHLFLLALALAAPVTAADGPPRDLRDTGLYADGTPLQVRPEHIAFTPQYVLWSDGATKRRWISLPPGTSVDASEVDAWKFPPGTRLWKEFAYGRPVETRYLERLADGSWRFATYIWNEQGTAATLVPAAGLAAAAAGAPGGRYTFPAEADCRACHEGARSPVLGFSALQLSPDRDPLAQHQRAEDDLIDLRTLAARGLVRGLPQPVLATPPRIAAASPTERAALGYLHANCGHCHSGTDAAPPVDLVLAQLVADAGQPARVRSSLLGASAFVAAGLADGARVLAPGRADQSVLVARMRTRDPYAQMPPLGTHFPDGEGLALVERWINSLPSQPESPP